MIRTVLAAMLLVATLSEACAASIDCSRASSTVERQICEDPTLIAADESMAESFASLRKIDPTLVVDQSEWLAERDRCATAECLSAAYLARIDQLDTRLTNAAPIPRSPELPSLQDSIHESENPPSPAPTEHRAPQKSQPSPDQQAKTSNPPSKPLSLWERAQSEAAQLAFLGIILFVLTMLILGANHRVVIYYDLMDFSWSFLWIISFVLATFVGSALLYKEGQSEPSLTGLAIIGTGTLTSIFSFIMVFWNSVRHNRNVPTGLLVGLFKIIFGVTFVLFLALASQVDQQRRRRTNWLWAALSAFLVVALYRSAINGPEVYARRGWQPPS